MKITHARKGDTRRGVIFTIPEEKWGLLVVYRAVRQSRNITFVLIPLSSVETSLCHREAGKREKNNLVPKAFPLKNGWGGKSPTHFLRKKQWGQGLGKESALGLANF